MTDSAADLPNPATTLRAQVRSAVLWRSGTQILGQMIAWGSTFAVIRILSPADYGLFAMTQVILVLLNMLNGYGLASALIQRADADERAVRQLFGMLILLNFGLGAAQYAAAPLAAAYFRHDEVIALLRVQSLLYVTTPFIALPYALLARAMDFRRQAAVNLLSATAGAIAALAGALAGLGVWTLVLAPLVLFTTRAIGMMSAARAWMWPSFDFRGAGSMARYGGLMASAQLFWFLQSQADVFIAGRSFDAHTLGIYTTSLFLAQIFVSKFVPALNDVAFSAYARLQDTPEAVARAFLTSVQLILLVAMPLYLGLAVTARPLVAVVLGEQWLATGPVVALLALAMPFMTVQQLFAPACDARGRPGISARNAATGAVVLGAGFLAGAQGGLTGLALAWVIAYPLFLLICAHRTLPAIGVSARELLAAAVVPAGAASAMAAVVLAVSALLPELPALPTLAVLIAVGAATYAAILFGFARETTARAIALVRHRG
ncbi:Membrane protein involved in the export of O-antigen and teichoic acid [Sphingomonas guangdongensis]|uniref:Membrane protein involved in the export of O-antigen and teichoic acid n=1 Tax=Sphingomonas guangdongensis TaxID=1141890 RepID=A0A285R2M6_9SPHN|nr:lipopolysaccharide biosynthesis protein [Sphingomonas guangdongensis]SOB88355.1 Membrane protein involved in the export of O-antigen and teichoic acid [Sphingomonas guangdongensis]